jgi:predicted transcriptional regulator
METLQSVVDAIPEQGTITEVVADKLGISVAFANTLMTRCMRKGMITREYNGEYFIYHAA